MADANPATTGIVHRPGEGTQINLRELSINLKVTGENTAGAWALLEYRVPPYFTGLPLHWHEQFSESYYVLSGTLTVQLENRIIQAVPGSFVLIPPRLLHCFSNEAAVTATFLSFVTPSGLEDFLCELAMVLQAEPSGPLPDIARFAALRAAYDIHLLSDQRHSKSKQDPDTQLTVYP